MVKTPFIENRRVALDLTIDLRGREEKRKEKRRRRKEKEGKRKENGRKVRRGEVKDFQTMDRLKYDCDDDRSRESEQRSAIGIY